MTDGPARRSADGGAGRRRMIGASGFAPGARGSARWRPRQRFPVELEKIAVNAVMRASTHVTARRLALPAVRRVYMDRDDTHHAIQTSYEPGGPMIMFNGPTATRMVSTNDPGVLRAPRRSGEDGHDGGRERCGWFSINIGSGSDGRDAMTRLGWHGLTGEVQRRRAFGGRKKAPNRQRSWRSELSPNQRRGFRAD